MRKLRKDDEVVVLAGKNKGQRGFVVSFHGEDRVVVSGVNMVFKHKRARQPGEREGILSEEASVHISNVAIFNPETSKPDRIGFSRDEEGKKQRVFRSNQQPIDV